MLAKFEAILERAGRLEPLPVAVAEPTDPAVLEGMRQAHAAGFVTPVLVGDAKAIRAAWHDLDPGDPPEIVSPDEEEGTAECAVRLVKEGRVQALAKGGLHTDELMRAVLGRLGARRRVSHVFLVELPSYHKLLFVTDAAVNIAPDLAAKAEILRNAVTLAGRLGIERPKVAVLSSVAIVRPEIPSSVHAAALSVMARRGQIPDAVVDGPLAFDNAISADAADTKGLESPVSGDVDILLVPDLDAGNILVKNLTHLAGATPAGVVVGARVPVILTSRADSPRARLVSAALASLLARESDPGD